MFAVVQKAFVFLLIFCHPEAFPWGYLKLEIGKVKRDGPEV